MDAEQFRHVADPPYPFPPMFKAMEAQKQQHVLQRQAEHRGTHQIDGLKALPQAFGIQ
jgi:hypothetical protein